MTNNNNVIFFDNKFVWSTKSTTFTKRDNLVFISLLWPWTLTSKLQCKWLTFMNQLLPSLYSLNLRIYKIFLNMINNKSNSSKKVNLWPWPRLVSSVLICHNIVYTSFNLWHNRNVHVLLDICLSMGTAISSTVSYRNVRKADTVVKK